MAATPTEPSPTTKATDTTTSTGGNKEASPDSFEADVSCKDKESKTKSLEESLCVEPTYVNSENSEWFLLAKSLLDKGNFEEALLTIEEGINATKDMIIKFRSHQNSTTPADDTITDDFHESLAPFHYLYGTTLLYSIEESDDNQAMTVGGLPKGGDQNGDSIDENVDAIDHNEALLDGDDQNPESNDIEPALDENEPSMMVADDNAEDMQIAWENLDLARAIIENMLKKTEDSGSIVDKLHKDLAQIYLREGDLQRTNSKYESAISDYDHSLQLLLKQKDSSASSDRKIADVHYNLALTHFMMVAAAKSSSSKESNQDDDDIDHNEGYAMKDRGNDDFNTASHDDVNEQKLTFARGRGYYHYVECSMILGGILASYCNMKPKDFFMKVLLEIPTLKSLPEDEKHFVEDPISASKKVCSLRKHVRLFDPPSDLKNKFDDIIMILDDIQETIDEAEKSEKGLQEVTEMKEMIAAAVATQVEPNNMMDSNASNPFGANNDMLPTTTIGFGATASSPSLRRDDASPAAEATTSTSTTVITTIQGRKKEKKREISDSVALDEDLAKRPRSE